MSLLGTLAKVAVGVAVAKGAKALLSGNSTRGQTNSNGLFGGANSPQSGGSPMDMISGLLSGGQNGARGQGGLGGILESLGGSGGNNSRNDSQGGGLTSLLGGLAGQMGGGAAAGAGGLGGLLAGLAGGGSQSSASNNQGFGAMLNQAIGNQGEPADAPSADQEAVAGLMLVAMVQAAKADGDVDKQEIANLTKDMGEIDQKDMDFLQAAMKSEIDVQGLVDQTPKGLEAQVYTVSVLAITLDSQAEAKYLDELARAYGIDQDQVNQIHDHLGVQRLYN